MDPGDFGSSHSSAVGKSALRSRNSRIHILLLPFFLSLHLPPSVETRLQVFALEGDICIVIELVSSLPWTESFAMVGCGKCAPAEGIAKGRCPVSSSRMGRAQAAATTLHRLPFFASPDLS